MKQIRRTNLDARFVFLEPPSREVLEQRLRGRGTETDESLRKRIDQAQREIDYANESRVHDKRIINDDLERAYQAFKEWVFEEKQEQPEAEKNENENNA